ncbi:glutamyl-tRNA reductase [Anaeromyxobacter dehalogenans 2CP-1]|uniref:Glutamyl-tRNA reductase n=1 Tax=Anaeromyxobacter dehalogenans (strain ATCC BAA-258 / DSM 21875 / 2CP-1) TaxID=455488 RepID=B8JHA1_ANAD2|nr:glutamyl-tRNA reductase [Anaeromyxobacter dehalogenans]ACL64803.1 glutamyl-tRNA reductase [Anaeromyxobacter dehalogenans 2CP-1]
MTGDRRLFLVGLSHKSAPIDVRERVALTGDALKAALCELKAMEGVTEALVVSTCNRVEVFVHSDRPDAARRFFTERSPAAADHLYAKDGVEAVRHLFRVAASLDSMVVGEQQILGQVKEAYGLASAASAAGSYFSRLCNRAFATAKRVRTETEIGRGATSMSQVAVELVEKIFGRLEGRAILLVGAGKMGALSARALAVLGADRILVTNRSPERGLALAAQVNGSYRGWEELQRLLGEADVVIVSTGAPTYVVTRESMQAAMKARRRRSICLIDLAVPRNVDPACAELSDVYAYDVDDMERVVATSKQARQGEAIRAEAIVEAEVMAFAKEREARAALPVLAQLRRHAERIARAEAERTLAQVGGKLDDKGRKSVEAMAQAIVNKLLHGPTSRLKEAASSGDSALPGAAAELFGIENEPAGGERREGGAEGAAAAPGAGPVRSQGT